MCISAIPQPASRRSLDEFDELFSGIALEAHPGPAFKKIKSVPSVSLRDLAGSLRSLVPAFWVVGILALFLEGCALIAPNICD